MKSGGSRFNKEIMANEEQRSRLILPDGSAYIRTEGSQLGAWQNSHYHAAIEETYIVHKGWIAFAELVNGRLNLKVKKEQDRCTVKPMVSHNLYLPANAIIFTVKHGNSVQGDWYEHKALDDLTKHLSEQQIKKIVEESFI